jgi:glycine/D-amino acid oxidase-like deaminating enzyme/nitrite reductase/ring-hydroxylating ferredoxin subunit
LTVDVAVVGAGITGVTAALLLKRAGLRVAVLESRRLGSGESKRTTAHLTQVLDLRFRRLRSRFGHDGAALALEGHRAAIDQIDSLTKELKIDCDFVRVSGYLVAETPEEVEELEDEASVARELGLAPRLVGSVPLPLRIARALVLDHQAQFQPRAYLDALAEQVDGGGSRIYETTHVQDIEDGEPCRVVTDRGVVTAGAVVVASGVPVSNQVFIHLKLAAYRSYAIAAKLPAPAAPGLLWDMKDPYHYVRGQVVNGVPYLIVGGEDHKVGEEDDTTAPFDRLEAYAAERLGVPVAATDFRWAGQIIESADGLPYVGRNSFSKHLFVATGYAGNGITGGTWAGSVLADQVRGVANRWSKLLDATRIKPLASAGAVASENVDYPKHLIADRLVPLGHRGALGDIPPGEGAVLSIQGVKLAVYRNGEGGLSGLSPVCPHMGCFVHWNSAEKSWDCPCHGSRFDVHGAVLNGPAVSALQRREIPAAEEAPPSPSSGRTPG